METKPVLFFDSGAGGLPYLDSARRMLPGERFAYLADSRNFPYGEKQTGLLKSLILKTMAKAVCRLNPKLVVVACNTASVVALAALREEFIPPFIGVVPAVKPAAETLKAGKLGVLATEQTVYGIYLEQLIKNFADHCLVEKIPLANIVNLVEYRFYSTTREEKIEILKREFGGLKKEDFGTIVLGCTHFVLLETEIKAVLGDTIDIVDSREGVANQLIRVLKKHKSGAPSYQGEHQLYITGNETAEERYRVFAVKYGLIYAGCL